VGPGPADYARTHSSDTHACSGCAFRHTSSPNEAPSVKLGAPGAIGGHSDAGVLRFWKGVQHAPP
jgi:hypothetical protein